MKYLLLGNGFTVNFNKDFSYHEMLLRLENSEHLKDQIIVEALANNKYFDGNDFEKLLEYFDFIKDLELKGMSIESGNEIDSFSKRIPDVLVNLITEIDNETIELLSRYSSAELNKIIRILNKFEKIFTLNFDSVLDYLDISSTVEYIHRDIDTNQYVISSNGDEKISKIKENEYLNTVWDSFSKIKGELYIFGASLTNSDKHIINIINNNKNIHKIVYYIYNYENKPKTLSARIREIFDGKSITIAKSRTFIKPL